MGKGGTSGKVSFPAYIQDTHHRMMHGTDEGGAKLSFIYPLVTLLNTALAPMGNPYADVIFTDPTPEFNALYTGAQALQTAIAAVNEKALWEDVYDNAHLAVANNPNLPQVNAVALEGSANTISARRIAAIIATAEEAGTSPEELYASLFTTAFNSAAQGAALSNVSSNTLLARAKTDTATLVDEALQIGLSGMDERVRWADVIKQVQGSMSILLQIRPDINVAALFDQAKESAADSISIAMTSARTAIDDNVIAALVTSFTNRQNARKANIIRQYTGGLADVNAVQTSAFAIGLALIEVESIQAIADFEAQVVSSTYTQALQIYGNNVASTLGALVQGHAENSRGRLEIALRSADSMLAVLANKVQAETAVRGLMGQLYGTNGELRSRVEGGNSERYISTLNASSQALTQLAVARTGFQQTMAQIYADTSARNLDALLRSELANVQIRHDEATAAANDTLQLIDNNEQRQMAMYQLLAEMHRVRVVAQGEYEGADADMDAKHAMWPLELYTRFAAILGAPSGMGSVLPPAPSRAGSAVGGAMVGIGGGAMLGAKIGAAGGPIGAVGGAVIGGVLGLAKGLLG